MSNWGTAKRRVVEETHRYGTLDDDFASRALCWAIDRFKTENLKFNQDTDDFSTVAGTYSYDKETSDGAGDGYPTYMVMPIELSLIVSDSYYIMTNEPIREFRRNQVASSYRGYPSRWVWEFEKFLFDPTPNGVYTVRVDYTKDLGTPVASYASSAWTYSVKGVSLTDAYTNAWFTQGMEVIVAAAKWWILSNVFYDIKGAQAAHYAMTDALMDIRNASRQSQIPGDAVGWY